MDFLYKARDAFNKAIRLNSSNPDAYLGRGIVFDDLGKPEQALADLTKAIELAPKNPVAYKRRADVFLPNGSQRTGNFRLHEGISNSA